MTIRPVASVSLVNRYNQLNFEGNKKKKQPQNNHNGVSNTISHKLAVPLAATIIAMSPMSSSASNRYFDRIEDNVELREINDLDKYEQSGRKIINTKGYRFEKTYQKANGEIYTKNETRLINFVSTDNDDSTFEEINVAFFDDTDKANPKLLKTYDLKDFAVYNYTIVSSDNSASNKFSLQQMFINDTDQEDKGNFTRDVISEKEICKFVRSELESPRNNSGIKITTYDRKIRPASSYDLQNVAPANTMKDAPPCDYSKYKRLGSQDYKGKNGNYNITYYSITGADEIELVSLKKDGGPALTVRANIPAKATFFAKDSAPQIIEYGIVELKDGDEKKHYISDMDLTNALTIIYNDPASCYNVFTCKPGNKEYDVTPKGAIVPLN